MKFRPAALLRDGRPSAAPRTKSGWTFTSQMGHSLICRSPLLTCQVRLKHDLRR